MKHLDAAAHTRGESNYVDDVRPPAGMLHAQVFSSPVAHGEVVGLDVTAARAAPGVVAVLTADDIPGENQIGPLVQDEPLLAEDSVHFAGQPVALVVAERPEQARKARHAIRLELIEKPAITDPRDAFARGEIIDRPQTFELGDVDAAWAECDVIVEGSCDLGGQEHVYLETQRARAEPLEGRNLRVASSTQSPSAGQKAIAAILDIPSHCVEIDVKRLGGGFGGKEDQATAWACLAALAARHTGRPVELVLDRADDVLMTGKRHPYLSDFKLGLRADGEIVAYQAWHYQNSGAAADLSMPVRDRTLFHSTNAYRIPNARLMAVCCRTNLPPNTAFRGFGGPQGMFVIESALAKAAEVMGMPRAALQRRNLLVDGDVFPYGQRAEAARAVATWDDAATTYDLPAIERRVDAHNLEHATSRKGFSVMPICFGISFTATHMNQASALVHVYTDGSVSVSTGGVEMGQGLSTNIATIAARTFGIRPARIKVESTNTTRTANVSPSAASAQTLLNGNATLLAVGQIVERLKRHAALQFGDAAPERIEIVDEVVRLDGADTGWTWERLVLAAYFARVGLSAHGFYRTPDVWFDPQRRKGRPFAYHVYGTAITEVTVDCLRGTYDVDAVHVVHDMGRPINRTVDLGQVEGGLAQGLGWMTMEDLRFARDGRIQSGALATYKVPDVFFMPDQLEVKFLADADNPLGPFHSKAVGEPPLMYGIGVYFALRHALRAFRTRDYAFDAPMTPERVLMALHGDRLAALHGAAEAAKVAARVAEPAPVG
ncbi:MAG: molybdopterin cofactor-binding domain-containing protein [Acidobacteriota bacterium]